MIDHYGLKYLFNHPILNARHERWMVLINKFDFEIKHIRGKTIEWQMHFGEVCRLYT
jgi:hypothetical protein